MSSILTPCDTGFPTKGIAAEAPPNEEAVITAEVETEMLYDIRQRGSATTLKDMRSDMIEELYQTLKKNIQKTDRLEPKNL